MRFALRWVATLAIPVMLLLGSTADAQKKADKDKDKDSDAPAESKMVRAGVLTGKIGAIYEDKRMIRLQVSVPTINPGALQSIAQAQAQMAYARGNPQAMLQARQALMRAQATMYQMTTKDIELSATDDVIVRTARPKEEFDEKGKIKRMTKAELKELKGSDPKMPGFKAEFGDVQTDQIVQVTLVMKKPTSPAPKPKPAKGKGKGKDADNEAVMDLINDNQPQISMIMIIAEPAPAAK
ncbi:MAG: hypothetical protein U0840_12915 [Gemmataceae bacterium]